MSNCLYCCCKNSSAKEIVSYLIIFIILTFILSLIAVFVRAGNSKRYNQAILYLDERDNNNINNTNNTFPEECRPRLLRILSDKEYKLNIRQLEEYCNFNGKQLVKQAESISFQKMFRSWKIIELIINISRLVLTGIYMVLLLFIRFKYNINAVNPNQRVSYEQQQRLAKLGSAFIRSTAFAILLTFTSSIVLIIRAFTFIANEDIGLYYKEEKTDFENYIVINYIIDIAIITLTGVAICFSIRVKQKLTPSPNNQINQNNPYQNNNIQPNYINNYHNQIPQNYPRQYQSYSNGNIIHPIDSHIDVSINQH